MAWFVPAQKDEMRIPVGGQFVVTRTTDGGESFTTYRDGLPTHSAYDIVYRHGLDIDEDGHHLMMASTTGNVWASSNLGETWADVARNLPPAYCVRFA